MKPPTYPARPVNGGPLDQAPPKRGVWYYEPKYNGWRALVHAPTGAMFNRHGQRLSIETEFHTALAQLKSRPFEWLDCEALERRHKISLGALIVFDLIGFDFKPPWFPATRKSIHHWTYEERHHVLMECLPVLCGLPAAEQVYCCPHYPSDDAVVLWQNLQDANARLGAPFYEGVVAKRADSLYPIQLRSPDQATCPFWVKHRWAF